MKQTQKAVLAVFGVSIFISIMIIFTYSDNENSIFSNTIALKASLEEKQIKIEWDKPANNIRYAVIGDYGVDSEHGKFPNRSRENELAVANLVKSWEPNFVLTVGDNNYGHGSAETIDQNVGKYYAEFIGNYQGNKTLYGNGSTINRFFPSIGNHDEYARNLSPDLNFKPYLDYFIGIPESSSGNKRYYDFVWGNVHFFAINSVYREPDGSHANSIQAMWLKNQLAQSKSQFNVVFFHLTPFTSIVHYKVPRLDWPFKEWGADIVLVGHAHSYERIEQNGLTYLVNGLGGFGRMSFVAEAPGTIVKYKQNYGAMLVDYYENSMSFQFININNTLIDSYTISKLGGIVGYEIDRKITGRQWEVLVENTNSLETIYSDREIVAGNEYSYRIAQIYTSGVGTFSEVVSVRFP